MSHLVISWNFKRSKGTFGSNLIVITSPSCCHMLWSIIKITTCIATSPAAF